MVMKVVAVFFQYIESFAVKEDTFTFCFALPRIHLQSEIYETFSWSFPDGEILISPVFTCLHRAFDVTITPHSYSLKIKRVQKGI